jgi:hypothetical protein
MANLVHPSRSMNQFRRLTHRYSIDSSEEESPANVTISERAWSRLDATTRNVVGEVWLTTRSC